MKHISSFIIFIACFFLSNQTNAQSTKVAKNTTMERLDSIVYLETFNDVIYNGNKEVWEYDKNGSRGYWNWYIWNTETQTWRGVQRADSTFNANGQLATIISDKWDNTTGTWDINKKEEWSYDTEGNVILINIETWDKTTATWQPSRKSENTYSSTPNISRIYISVTYIFDANSGEWTISHRNELNYDANGKMTLYNASFYDTVSGSWKYTNSSFKYENAYNAQGKQTLYSYYKWDESLNQWKGQGNLIEIVYDEVGNKVLEVNKEWDETSHQWINSTKTESVITDNNLLLQKTDYIWETSTNAWINQNKTANIYNESNILTGTILSDWDTITASWKMISQQEVSYDTKGNISQQQTLKEDTLTHQWYVDSKIVYAYDVNNKETSKDCYRLNDAGVLVVVKKTTTDYDNYGNTYLVSTYEQDSESGELIKSNEQQYTYNAVGNKLIEESTSMYFDGIPYVQKTNYYYSTHSTETGFENITGGYVIYPNPFNNQLTIDLNDNFTQVSFELFSVQGQKVLSTGLLHSMTIDIEGLPNGVYFYKIRLDNQLLKGKLLKQ